MQLRVRRGDGDVVHAHLQPLQGGGRRRRREGGDDRRWAAAAAVHALLRAVRDPHRVVQGGAGEAGSGHRRYGAAAGGGRHAAVVGHQGRPVAVGGEPAAAAVPAGAPRSYVLAYYMFGGGAATRREREEAAAQNRFEDLQGQLEHHVEVLSRTLAAAARPADAAEVVKAKRDADNLARVVEGLCAGMYRCVQDELLPLLVEPMNIAAYHPDGPAMAKEFPPATSVTGGAPPATRH